MSVIGPVIVTMTKYVTIFL